MAWKALEAGLIFLIWREALSSEEPVGGASGTGVMDGGVVVAVFTPQRHKFVEYPPTREIFSFLSKSICPRFRQK